MGDVNGLPVQHIGEVGRETGLGEPHVEAVRKAVAQKAVVGLHAVGPVISQRQPVTTVHLELGAPRIRRPDLEAGRVDQTVYFVLDAVHDHRVLGDTLDALTLGIDQLDVGPVKGRQVFVVKGRALAPLSIPGLERFRSFRVGDGCGHARPNLIHLLVVGNLRHDRHTFVGQVRILLTRKQLGEFLEQAGPLVANEVFLNRNPGQNGAEVVVAVVLPAGLQRPDPFRVGRFVAALIHRGRRALEYVELFGVLAQMRHGLDRGGSGANDTHALIFEFVHAAGGITAGVVIVPTAGVKGMAFELFDAGNRRQLGPVQGSARHDHKARSEDIVAIGGNRPASVLVVPARLPDLGLEAGPLVEVEVLADPLGVLKNFRRKGVFFLRHVAGLFEQGQIDVGLNVTLRAGVAVPIPGPAKISGLLDEANIGDPGLLQPRRRQQAAKAATDNHRVEFFVQRGAGEARLHIGIGVIVGVLAGDFLILVVSVHAQTLGPLIGVLLTQVSRIKAQFCGGWNSGRLGLHYRFTHLSALLIVSPLKHLNCFVSAEFCISIKF